MNDIYITLTGNVAAEPRQYSFDEGVKVTSLRVLTTHRYFDRKTGQWVDGEKVCFAVRCWRALGENVAASVRAGQPVVVSGKLRIREFGAEGDRRFMPEIEASAVGHDLRWGTGAFTKPERAGGGSVSKEMRDRLDEETRDWAMGPRAQRSLTRSGSREEPNPFHTTDAGADRMRPATADDGLPPTFLPNDGSALAPEPFDGTASTLNPATAPASAPGADTPHLSAPGADTPHFSVSGADMSHASASGSGPARPLGPGGDPARPLGPGDDTTRVPASAGGTVRSLTQEEGTGRSGEEAARELRSADGDVGVRAPSPASASASASAENAVRALDPDDNTNQTVGPNDQATPAPTSDGEMRRALSPNAEATRALHSEGSPVRKRGPKGAAVRAAGAEGGTARNLGSDAGGKGRDAGGRKSGRDGKQLTMPEKAAA
ncbi:single-stranded DNA-binding protein [Nonomuraea thailandensis]|uniref:Single-stranded DNA-binding protein n=1 Tax=Nonomuraea thailandensis TaxID=1188745 RepID=A0A9X2H1F3_9ACTN|nr:single-stranded DNA-binding protein [Nonomuraea thailandensis]MCP2365626.1 single-stranded DNA-binding protein [Nonomuraea thailandensis]